MMSKLFVSALIAAFLTTDHNFTMKNTKITPICSNEVMFFNNCSFDDKTSENDDEKSSNFDKKFIKQEFPLKSIYEPRRPRYWFHHQEKSHYIFDCMDRVLQRLDLEKIEMNLSQMHYDWDLLWAYQFHFLSYLPFNWSKLEYYQKINHIPGEKFPIFD